MISPNHENEEHKKIATASINNLSSLKAGKGVKVAIADIGFPGFLSCKEFKAYESFRNEVYSRDKQFRETIFSFGEDVEEEPYGLCRWLRSCKFDLCDTVRKVEDAMECRQTHREQNFYPNPNHALGGVDSSTYIAQYPQTYHGVSKDGCPVFISKPGLLCALGIECITTMEGIIRYHWYEMIHNFGGKLRESVHRNPMMKRCECLLIMDLVGLSSSKITKRVLHIIQAQSKIDSTCFPETVNRVIIINAPSFFSMTWRMMKGWADPRTADKVEIFSNQKVKETRQRLLELIDDDQLPVDYGGKSTSTKELLSCGDEQCEYIVPRGINRKSSGKQELFTNLITLQRSSKKHSFEIFLQPNEILHINVFTRCTIGANFSVVRIDMPERRKPVCHDVIVRHNGRGNDEENPSKVDFFLNQTEKNFYEGPATFQVLVETCNTSYQMKKQHFLVEMKRNRNVVAVPDELDTHDLQSKMEDVPLDSEDINTHSRIDCNNVQSSTSTATYVITGSPVSLGSILPDDATIPLASAEILVDVKAKAEKKWTFVEEGEDDVPQHKGLSYVWACGWNSCW